MEATVTKGYTQKVVTVRNVDVDTDAEVLAFALDAANETRSSIFGHTMRVADDFSGPEIKQVTIVTLYTD